MDVGRLGAALAMSIVTLCALAATAVVAVMVYLVVLDIIAAGGVWAWGFILLLLGLLGLTSWFYEVLGHEDRDWERYGRSRGGR